eukprot:11336005-Alexandrium_andersonii.AAC.1
MVSLPTSAELQASRVGPALPGTPKTTLPIAKHLPAAKRPPNFEKNLVYASETSPATLINKNDVPFTNAMNLAP